MRVLLLVFIAFLPCAGVAQTGRAFASAAVPFRTSEKVEISNISLEPAEQGADTDKKDSSQPAQPIILPGQQQADLEALGSKSLEQLDQFRKDVNEDLSYAQAQLKYTKRKLASAEVSGSEKLQDYQQQMAGWEQRIVDKKALLAAVEKEIERAKTGRGGSDGADDLIAAGDTLEVFVVEDNSYNGRYQVRRGGYIILPQIGRIPVIGKTLQGAEKSVKTLLEQSQLRHGTVMIERVDGSAPENAANGPLVFLAGEFKNPRPWRFPDITKPTLVGVILSAGGVTEQADLKRVRVMRVAGSNKGIVEEVNVESILNGEGLVSDMTLSEGDTVMVPRRSDDLIYLTGRVKKPGAVPFTADRKLNVYEAILLNGGLDRFADLKKSYILRSSQNASKVKIPVDLSAIQKGRCSDIQLEGNDIIVVPEKFFSF